MLVLGLLITLTASALPSIYVTSLNLTRCATLIFLSTGVIAMNGKNIQAMGSGVSISAGLLEKTSTIQAIDILLSVSAAAIVGFVWPPSESKFTKTTVKTSIPPVTEYSHILVFTTLGAIILGSSTNLVTLYLGVELQSFAVYVLACLYRNSEKGSEAALKYFFIGGLSSAFILIGGAIIYWQTGTTDIWHIINLINSIQSQQQETQLGLETIILGILMKSATTPFHFWAPDVYDGVPTVVTTWLTLIPKISLLTFALNLTGNFSNITNQILLATCSILSLIIGTIVGLAQVRIKRLLAYSTISHVGFLLLAISVITQIGVDAFTFYLSQYTITTLNAFLILLALGYCLRAQTKDQQAHGTDLEEIKDLEGQFYVNPVLGLAFSACLFSIAGVPPFVGFFGKQAVLLAAIQADYAFLAIVGIITSVISGSYYLGLVRTIHFEAPKYKSNFIPLALTSIHSYVIAGLTLIVSLFILVPYLVFDSTNLLALAIYSA